MEKIATEVCVDRKLTGLKHELSDITSETFSYGSGSTISAYRRGSVVTVVVDILTTDLGVMGSWETKQLATLSNKFRSSLGTLMFPVIHDRANNVGGAIMIYGGGGVWFNTRGGSLAQTDSTAHITATCTYIV